jgi:DNA-binding CsgD family transcriptional regulator
MARIRSDHTAVSALRAMATNALGAFREEQPAGMRTDVVALICPDWRLASLVMDGRTGQIAYANTPCLQMLADRSSLQVVAGRFGFVAPQLTDRFYATLDRMLANGLENAALVERDRADGSFISVMIRNTQGFFRDVLNRSLGGDEQVQLVIVEFATSRDQSDWTAMRAFAQTFDLAPMETEIADLIVRGLSSKEIAALKRREPADIRRTMKRLLTKTRCKHQAELVRLIMTLCPPIRWA